jgi:nucleoid-associated protein YgaU
VDARLPEGSAAQPGAVAVLTGSSQPPIAGSPSDLLSTTRPADLLSDPNPRLALGGDTLPGASVTLLNPPPSTGGETKTYVVKQGDTLWDIAQAMYNDGSKFRLIVEANRSIDANNLKLGQKLVIPPLPGSTPSGSDSTGLVTGDIAASGQTYVVQAGDNGLWAIAKKVYGDGSKYDVIAKANPGVKSSALRVGQKLVIPKLDGAGALSSGSTTRPAATVTHRATTRPAREPVRSTSASPRPMFD